MSLTRSRRSRIALSVKLQVLAEAGYMCGNPRSKHILTLELHHLEWVRDGGGNDPTNLIALCSNCHDLHTRGHIPRGAIEAWKQMLMLVAGSLDRESLDLLLFMHRFEKKTSESEDEWNEWLRSSAEERKALEASEHTSRQQLRDHDEKWNARKPIRERQEPIQVTGDGLLRLVRLIRTGLVDEGPQMFAQPGFLYLYWEPVPHVYRASFGRRFPERRCEGFQRLACRTIRANSVNGKYRHISRAPRSSASSNFRLQPPAARFARCGG
jgi:hypothetical protein